MDVQAGRQSIVSGEDVGCSSGKLLASEVRPWWLKRHQEGRTYTARLGPQHLLFLVWHGVGSKNGESLRNRLRAPPQFSESDPQA